MEIKRRLEQAIAVRRLQKAIGDYDKALLFGNVVSDDVFNTLWTNLEIAFEDLWETTAVTDPTQEPEMREIYAHWCGTDRYTGNTSDPIQDTGERDTGNTVVEKLRSDGERVSGYIEKRETRTVPSSGQEQDDLGGAVEGGEWVDPRVQESVQQAGKVDTGESERRLPRFIVEPNSTATVPVGFEIQTANLFKQPETSGQPIPSGKGRAITPLVIQDLKARSDAGLAKYGERLHSWNGRSSLWDAYEEILDLAQYFRQVIEEEEDFFKSAIAKLNVATGRVSGKNLETLHNDFVDFLDKRGLGKYLDSLNTPPSEPTGGTSVSPA